MKNFILATTIGFALSLSACATTGSTQTKNVTTTGSKTQGEASAIDQVRARAAKVKKGMTKAQVRDALGEPNKIWLSSGTELWDYENDQKTSTTHTKKTTTASTASVLGGILGGTAGRALRTVGGSSNSSSSSSSSTDITQKIRIRFDQTTNLVRSVDASAI